MKWVYGEKLSCDIIQPIVHFSLLIELSDFDVDLFLVALWLRDRKYEFLNKRRKFNKKTTEKIQINYYAFKNGMFRSRHQHIFGQKQNI